jgi:alpha-1,3-mannosyltransferase
MIIAHVVRQYYPSVGGFEEVVKNLAKHQLAAGQQPYVITLNRYFKALDETLMAEELIEGIKVICFKAYSTGRHCACARH